MKTLIVFNLLSLCTSVILGAWLISARRWEKKWKKLFYDQAENTRQAADCYMTLKKEVMDADNLRKVAGMETVSHDIACKYMDIQRKNIQLTAECDILRLQAAKYMDLYREERYKPRQQAR